MWKRICLVFGLGVVFGGCSEVDDSRSGDVTHYFDLAGFVGNQIVLLENQKPEVEKMLTINGKEERIVTREVDWADDLGFFVDADINKSSLKDSYTIAYPDSSTTLYQLKAGVEFPVSSIRVVRVSPEGDVREIAVHTGTENRLFANTREMSLKLTDGRVSSFEVKGTTSPALGQDAVFEVKAIVNPI